MSSKHHYIPQFVIKGFTNHDQQLFIYDRSIDKIHPKTRPTKSIFWEDDRNTMFFGNRKKSSIIEDKTYQNLDNHYKRVVEKLRDINLNNEGLDSADTFFLHLFVIHLFWRIPETDQVWNVLFEIIEKVNKNKVEGFNVFEALKKHERINQLNYSFKEVKKHLEEDKFKYKLIEFESPYLILGDYPILFENPPLNSMEIDTFRYFFPISNRRVMIKSPKEVIKDHDKLFEHKHAILYNALVIDQSLKYVISGNKEILQKSVNLYNNFKKKDQLLEYKRHLFDIAKF